MELNVLEYTAKLGHGNLWVHVECFVCYYGISICSPFLRLHLLTEWTCYKGGNPSNVGKADGTRVFP